MGSSTYVALLRGVNVGGRNRVPMAALRSLATDLGWTDVRSYVQSGNLVFGSAGEPWKLAVKLEMAIEHHSGLSVPVIIRHARDWASYLATNPFPEASEREPNLVMLALSKEPPREGAMEQLRARATQGERVHQAGDAFWLQYRRDVGRSKLSPGLLDRLVGSPVTTRNWRTVMEIAAMAGVGAG